MDRDKNYLALEKYSRDLGVDLFGVADITEIRKEFVLAQDLAGKFDRAISLGLRLSGSILEELKEAPTKLYFHHYRGVNNFLDQIALRLANFIQGAGYLSLPFPASQILDWQNQKGHLSHKQIGYLAGLGWIGRNNLLVNKKLGSQFRLVTILTSMPLKTDRATEDTCLTCRRCVSACPAEAIKEKPADFDHKGCFEKLKEFQRQKLVDQYICGICVNVCDGVAKT